MPAWQQPADQQGAAKFLALSCADSAIQRANHFYAHREALVHQHLSTCIHLPDVCLCCRKGQSQSSTASGMDFADFLVLLVHVSHHRWVGSYSLPVACASGAPLSAAGSTGGADTDH